MPKLILEGGTDVAEVAFFCLADIPREISDNESVCEMQKRHSLVRLPTGADGGYLLHLYEDELVDDDIWQYCVKEDKLTGEFLTKKGNIGFGGLESTYSKFEPNKNIREDGIITQGNYLFSAYHTDYPNEVIEKTVEDRIGKEGMKIIEFPGHIIMVSVVLILVFLFLAFNFGTAYLIAAVAVIPFAVTIFKTVTKTEKYIRVDALKSEVERKFPSIVIHLVSI